MWGGLGIAVAGADRRLQLPAPTALPLPLRRDLHNTRLVHVEIFDLPLSLIHVEMVGGRSLMGAALLSWLLGVTWTIPVSFTSG